MNYLLKINTKTGLAAVSLFIVLAAGLGSWYKWSHSTPGFNFTGQIYKMPASKNERGTGMSFELPQGFTEQSGGSAYTKVFVQKTPRGKTTRSIVAIRRLSDGQSPLITQTNSIKGFNSLVSHISSVVFYDKKSPNFQKFDINSALVGSNSKTTSSQVGIKVLPEINENFQLKAANSSPAEVDATLRYRFNNKSAYYLIVGSTGDTWQKDQSAWKKVLASLKIDL